MNTKLTLSIDKYLINEVKKYAKQHHTNVSSLFTNAMTALTEKKDIDIPIEPVVKELIGIIPKKYAVEDLSCMYKKHLETKYL